MWMALFPIVTLLLFTFYGIMDGVPQILLLVSDEIIARNENNFFFIFQKFDWVQIEYEGRI